MSSIIYKIFEDIWTNVVYNGKAHEREFLREIHGIHGLKKIATAVNSELILHNKFARFTSIWVDHTPQCYVQKKNGWGKPSCELADLLIIVRNGHSKKVGKALLIQAKMANKPFVLVANNASTKNQLKLMSTKYSFLLSNNTNNPIPYTGNENTSVFNLSNLIGNNYHHQFLQIKKSSSSKKNWPACVSSWIILWPLKKNNADAYSTKLLDMCLHQNTIGADFNFDNNGCDWSQLVKLLFETTVNSARHGTAKGSLQNTVQFMPNDFSDFMKKNYPAELAKRTLNELNKKIKSQENKDKLLDEIDFADGSRSRSHLVENNGETGISTLIIDVTDFD